jgi:hypothetical protein
MTIIVDLNSMIVIILLFLFTHVFTETAMLFYILEFDNLYNTGFDAKYEELYCTSLYC